ncbi:MAG: DUF4383 domain-containing protein [Cyanosarcina radialis HA8281-LM2]|jgi:uncharacterized membrane protein|nr:DUF4383 domain-containing protein [Cyanosarcina radialis HA8281-LM2]
MKPGQQFALIIGIVFVLLGVAGFIPGLVQPPTADPDAVNLGVTNGYGYLLGLFPVNLIHNLVHLIVGLLGIIGSLSLGSARLYSGAFAISYWLIALMGLFPPTQSTLGLMPIFGNNVWFNAMAAAIATYFGFIAKPDLAELREQDLRNQAASTKS